MNEAQSKVPILGARASGVARAWLFAVICLAGCSEDVSIPEASEPSSFQQGPPANEVRATTQGSLHRVFDSMGSWPALNMLDLQAHLAPSVVLDIVGKSASIVGPQEVAAALTRLQTATPLRRLHILRTYETSQSLVIEFEFWRCQAPKSRACDWMRAGLLYAWKARDKVTAMKLFVGDEWLERPTLSVREKASHWVVGRPHTRLERLFTQIWEGSLSEWVDPDFSYRDMASGLELRGLAPFSAHRAAHGAAMEAGSCTVQEMESAGDIVMALSRCEGMLARPLRGEGRKFSVHVADIGRFEGGKLVELRTYSRPSEALAALKVDANEGGTP